jgi:hypothetical protein
MAVDPRFALKQFQAALEKHLEATYSRRGPEDLSVDQAYEQLEEAFLNYQEAFGDAFQDDLPFDLPDYDDGLN